MTSKPAKRKPSKKKPAAKAPVNPPVNPSQEVAERTIKFEASKKVQDVTPNKLFTHTVGRLFAIMKSHGAEEPNQSQQDFCLTAFAQMAPRNTSEVLLIQQMIACHEVGLNMLTRAKHTTSQVEVQEAGNLATKLLGLFERQFSALERARRPAQTVTVLHEHRHVHVGQAPGPTGEAKVIEGQPYESTTPAALALAAAPQMLGETPEVAPAVPVPSDGKRPLPHSRGPFPRRTKR